MSLLVWGTGSIGQRHLNLALELGVPTYALSTRPGRRTDLEAKGISIVTSLPEAKERGIKNLVIATNTQRHYEDLQLAIQLGFDILCEKPLTLSSEQALHINSLAKKNNIKLAVACQMRFEEGYLELKNQLPKIGKIHAAEFKCRSYFPGWRPQQDYRVNFASQAGSGGVLFDLIHDTDVMLWLLGKPQFVSGFAGTSGHIEVKDYDNVAALFEYQKGVYSSMQLDYLTRHTQRSALIMGNNGEIHYDFVARKLQLTTINENNEWNFAPAVPAMYKKQLQNFLNWTDSKSHFFGCTVEEAISGLHVLEQWKKSQDTGKKLTI